MILIVSPLEPFNLSNLGWPISSVHFGLITVYFPCIYLYFPQSANGNVIHRDAGEDLIQRIQARGLFDEIKKYVDMLLDLLNQKLTEIELSGNSFIDKVEATATVASQNVSNIVDTGISLIQATAKQVIDNGLDATQCLGTVIEGLEDLKGSAINDLTKCSTDRYDCLNF